MRFDQKNFNDDKKYPSRHLSQWKCLHGLIKKQPGTRKVTDFAEIAKCAPCTLMKALEKNLEKKPNILSFPIAKRIALAKGNPKLLGRLCPDWKEMEKILK